MRIRIENKVSLILILMAAASLVSMLATLNIDHIVNHDLYSYGLQFSTKWADPYWRMSTVVFSMGWLIIATSIAFELYSIVHRLRGHAEPEAEAAFVHEKLVQNETATIETKPSDKPEEPEVKGTAEEEVKTTALAVKTDDGLSEFRLIVEEVSETAYATVARQKTDDKPTDCARETTIPRQEQIQNEVQSSSSDISVTVGNTGTTPLTINELWINNVKHTSVSPALPCTIQSNDEAVFVVSTNVSAGRSYQVRLVSAKGRAFIYTRTAPARSTKIEAEPTGEMVEKRV